MMKVKTKRKLKPGNYTFKCVGVRTYKSSGGHNIQLIAKIDGRFVPDKQKKLHKS